MLEKITHESFEALVGETLNLKAGETSFQADVESVTLLRENPGQGRRSFSVLLQAHDASNHGQQMYQISHPDLGELDLFLVPVGPGEKGMNYELVFN